jgi:hypothetical protein
VTTTARLNETFATSVTIPISSNTHLDPIDLWHFSEPRGGFIIVPSVWTAADIIFQFAPNGDTVDLATAYDHEGTEVRISGIKTNAKGIYHLPAEIWAPIQRMRYMKILSVTVGAATAVNQAAERTLYLYTGN